MIKLCVLLVDSSIYLTLGERLGGNQITHQRLKTGPGIIG